MDLATLALLAETHELVLNRRTPPTLHRATLRRLRALAGERPALYWDDLLGVARTLKLLEPCEQRWCVQNPDHEILGATAREVFPALCAAWLRAPGPWAAWGLSELGLVGLRLDVLRLVSLLDDGRWHVMGTMAELLRHAFARHGRGLDERQAQELAPLLVERVLRVLGAAEQSADGTAWRLQGGLQWPPLPAELARCACRGRAEEPKRMSAAELIAQAARKAGGLTRCTETRRGREAQPESLRCLEEDLHVEADPRTPFRDCLFLARLGALVSSQGAGCKPEPGAYVFRLDPVRILDQMSAGISASEIVSFLEKRCADAHLHRLQARLAVPWSP